MRRLLWIGDAGCPTGFARCTHKTCDWLDYRSNPSNPNPWEVHVLGLNYRGNPDVRRLYPYDIYPAAIGKTSDYMGYQDLPGRMVEIRPDVVVVQNDPWNMPMYLEILRGVPTIAAVAVDGLNCRGRELNGLHCAVFWTQFGADQAIKGGYKGPYSVVGLGVDQTIYKPMDRKTARKNFFRPRDFLKFQDAFIVSNTNRNQPRKRMDLTISYFCEWVKEYKIGEEAMLHLHAAPTGESATDLQQLMEYYGCAKRLIVSAPDIWVGVEESILANNYNIADVGLTTTQGEGWGLTTMEMMASGIPQIVPDWAALGEWPGDSVVKVPCSTIACTTNGINVIGGIADRQKTIEALDWMYTHPEDRTTIGQAGFDRVSLPGFRWETVGSVFAQVIDAALDTLGVTLIKCPE